METTYAPIEPGSVAGISVDRRSKFIMKTYSHLALALIALAGLEVMLFVSGLAEPIARAMLSTSWLIPMGAFMFVSWIASRFAHRSSNLAVQYLALSGFVVAQALILVPMLYIALIKVPGAISSAGMVTLLGAGGLTATAFITRKDFSFLRGVLVWGGMLALVAIVASVIFGFQMGTLFSVAMIGYAGCAVLHDTSNIIHHFPEDRYVGAALELFASIALMFWYVLQIFLSGD